MRRKTTELFLSLFMMKRKDLLEDILGMSLDKIDLEINNGRKKIDFVATNAQRRLMIYIENQKKPSDRAHLKDKVKSIIFGLQEGIVVWISPKFNVKHIAEVKDLLNHSKHKYINFYAIEISSELLLELEGLNEIDQLEIWSKLGSLDKIIEPYRVFYKQENIPKSHLGKSYIQYHKDLDRIEDVQGFLLEHLRKTTPEFLNIHTSKKFNESNRSISIGGGKDGITYKCSSRDCRNRAYVKLCFDNNRRDVFNKFKVLLPLMQRQIHPFVIMEKRSIGVFFPPLPDLLGTASQIAEIFGKMIRFFSPLIYGNEDINSYLCKMGEKKEARKVSEMIQENPRQWLMMPGIEPWIAELLAEEVDDERALQTNQERMADYLM
jgi:hypothetical protein